MTDSVCDVVWVRRFADVSVVDRVAHGGSGVMYGQAYVIDNSHWCILVTP